MLYVVIKDFQDLEDNKRYNEKDGYYPRKGLVPSDERVKLLVEKGYIESAENKDKVDKDSEFPKHTGGGHYELSNGEKVQGKDNAVKAESKLEEGD